MERRPHGRHSEVLAPLPGAAASVKRRRRLVTKARLAGIALVTGIALLAAAGVLFVVGPGHPQSAQPAAASSANQALTLQPQNAGALQLKRALAQRGVTP